jgi:hypothetical protein
VDNVRKCAAALLLLIASACQTAPPPSPQSVPAEAFWTGGPDGGVFVILSRESGTPSPVVRVEVYNDSTGEPLIKDL